MIKNNTHTLSKTITISVMVFSVLFSVNSYAGGASKHESKFTPKHPPSYFYTKSYGHITTSDSLDSSHGFLLLGTRVFGVRIINENKK